MRADLHIHTTASDGALTPTEVVKWAAESGLEVISVTDHDTVDGLEEAEEAAKSLGVRFVNGIEISAFSVSEIHILGYNIDRNNEEFLAALKGVKDMRKTRNALIGEKLYALGVSLDMDFEAEGVGRMNIARELVTQGYAKDVNEAFDKYLGIGGKAYCQTRRITPLDAVKLINSCGGLAVVAHPKKFLLDGRLSMLVEGLCKFGLKGLEVNYPSHNSKEINTLLQMCKRYKLLPTGGSDFHGDEDKKYAFELDERTKKALKVTP